MIPIAKILNDNDTKCARCGKILALDRNVEIAGLIKKFFFLNIPFTITIRIMYCPECGFFKMALVGIN